MNKHLYIVLMTFAIFQFGFAAVERQDGPALLPMVKQDKMSMQDRKAIEQIRLDLRGAMAKIKDAALDDFEKQLFTKDAQGKNLPPAYEQMKTKLSNRTEVIPLLLAGMERRQEQAGWAHAIWIRSSSDLLEMKSLPVKQKKAHGQYTLAYLQEALDMARKIPAVDPNQAGRQDDTLQLLKDKAAVAMELDELELAKQTAEEMLTLNTDIKSWNYGNVIHRANTILGRVALRRDDLEKAKQYLIQSGKTPGSPQLDSIGPSFMLARELLEKGQKETVLQYLDLIALFWANPEKARPYGKKLAKEHVQLLSKWKQKIKDGKIPDAPQWLVGNKANVYQKAIISHRIPL
jgi:hypothetical protein